MPTKLTDAERKAIRDFLRWRGHSLHAANVKVDEYERARLAAPMPPDAQSNS